MTTKQAAQIIEVLTRIAVALEKKPDCEVALAGPPDLPKRKSTGRVPAYATNANAPQYGRCKFCSADIMWEETPQGWRPYDPTNPFPRHSCKKRAAQDTADLLPGGPIEDPNTQSTQ